MCVYYTLRCVLNTSVAAAPQHHLYIILYSRSDADTEKKQRFFAPFVWMMLLLVGVAAHRQLLQFYCENILVCNSSDFNEWDISIMCCLWVIDVRSVLHLLLCFLVYCNKRVISSELEELEELWQLPREFSRCC